MNQRLLALAIIFIASALRGAAVDLLVLDPLAAKNACVCVRGHAQRDYDALAAYLSQSLDVAIQTRYGAVLAGQPAIIVGKQSEIEYAGKQADLTLTHIAMLTDKTGSTNLHGLFVVRRLDKARTLADLNGRTILLGRENAAEKHAAALTALRQAGVKLPATPEQRDTCNQAGADVAEKNADAAVISSYALPLLEGCQTVAKGELRVIGRTADVPFVALYLTGQFPASLRPVLEQALQALAKNKKLCEAMESANGFVLVEQAADGWTDWRGPNRAAQSANVPAHLPAKPQFLWRQKLSSQSLGGVAATKSVVIVSDKSADGNEDIWRCLDAHTGKQKWEFRHRAPGKLDYTNAPRAVPVIADGLVYLFGALGHFHCVGLHDGKLHWQHDLRAEFHGELPTWGFCATPLVVDERVIVPAAAKEALLVAFDRQSGRRLWQTPGGRAGYGNFICRGGQVVGFDSEDAGGWDARTGVRLWTLKPARKPEFNVPTPAWLGERLLLASDQTGARLHDFDSTGRPAVKPVAQNPEIKPNITSPVVADGFVWLTTEEGLYCLNEKLQVVWKQETEPFTDAANLIAGNHHVLILTKNGTLALLPAKPDASAKPELLLLFPAADTVEAWSQPALVDSRLYVRTDGEVLCVSLAP